MINHYAAEKVMLPRPLTDLYESVREFLVAEDEGGGTMGCGALKFYNAELAEIRSLCVAPETQHRGTGRLLTERLLAEAESFGLKTVFALTLAPEFFLKLGFREVARERFPMKIWRDCLRCDRYFHCHEKTIVFGFASSSPGRQRADRTRRSVRLKKVYSNARPFAGCQHKRASEAMPNPITCGWNPERSGL